MYGRLDIDKSLGEKWSREGGKGVLDGKLQFQLE